LLLLCAIAAGSIGFSKPSISSQAILDEVNQDRMQLGFSQLSLSPTLSLAAYSKAQDMIANDYFAHISPSGVKPWHWFRALGYAYTYAGENLAAGYTNASELEESWMNSPPHRANILSPFYDELGLAMVASGDTTLVVQFFGSRNNRVSLRE